MAARSAGRRLAFASVDTTHSRSQRGHFQPTDKSITFQEQGLLELVVVEQFPQEEPVPDSLARHLDPRWHKESWSCHWPHKRWQADSSHFDGVARHDSGSDRVLPRPNYPLTDLSQQPAAKMSRTCDSCPQYFK
jgi:hypothetical protein